MNPITEKLIELNKGSEGLLFDNMCNLVLSFFPEKLNTSHRKMVEFDRMVGVIVNFSDIIENVRENTYPFRYSELLEDLCHAVLVAIHKIGLIYDEVEPPKINRKYIRYYFEEETLKRRTIGAFNGQATVDERIEIEKEYCLDDVKEYCVLNKVRWYLDIVESDADLS